MAERHSSVGIFESHSFVEKAIEQLKSSGVDMKKLSIVGLDQHTDERAVGYFNTGDHMMYWGTQGEFWDGVWGMLPGAGFFWVPGMGTLLVAGPLVNAITGAINHDAGAGKLSVVGAGLFSLGIPKDEILKYESAIRAGLYLAVYYGTDGEVEEARTVFDNAKALVTTMNPSVRSGPA